MDNDDLASALRALAHPARLQILTIMTDRSQACCCNDVTDCLSLAQSTVSQHLKVLLDAGLIERQAQGTRNNYRVRGDRLAAVSDAFAAYAREVRAGSRECTGVPTGEAV